MSIGTLIIGMFVGMIAGGIGLLSGFSFLMALWLYTSVGVLSFLSITVALCVVHNVQKRRLSPQQLT